MDTQKTVVKKKKTRFFETYISKVLKQVSEQNGITANAKQQLNSVLCLVTRLLAHKSSSLTEIAKKKTMSEKEVRNALRLVLPKDLATQATEYGQTAINNYNNDDGARGSISRQEKAGIVFPPSITEKFLRNFGYSKAMVTGPAPVYLAGSLEAIASRLLSNAVTSAHANKRVRLTVRDLEIGVRSNSDLDSFFNTNRISFLGGGVSPYIHPSLLAKKIKKKRAVPANQPEGEKKKHRFRPGTVSVREIRRFQKMSNCLTFAKFPFEKFVRQVVAENIPDDITMKISKDVFIVLQYFIEQQVVALLRDANFAAIHAGRVKLMPTDILFVRYLSSGGHNPYRTSSLEEKVEDDVPAGENVELNVVEEEEDVEDIEEEELLEEEA